MVPTSVVLDQTFTHPIGLLCNGILILVFVILTFIYLGTWKRNRTPSAQSNLLLSLAIVLILIGIEGYIYQDMNYQMNFDILEYTVTLESSSEGYDVVWLPVTMNERLQNKLRLSSDGEGGKGGLEIVTTEHGLALKVNFTGAIRIHGKLDTTSGIGDHDLTMVNESYRHHWQKVWIGYQPHNTSEYNCSYSITLYHNAFDWWETHFGEGYLAEEWEVYEIRHSAES